MAGFDVSSLLTNIPLHESTNECTDIIFEQHETIEYNDYRFYCDNFRELLCFAERENHFMFYGQLYDQCRGVEMASPLGPTLTNVLMGYLENRYLNDCPPRLKPIMYRRYVDDTVYLGINEMLICLSNILITIILKLILPLKWKMITRSFIWMF